jgi:predicted naringenin-chalcone synthase
MMNSLVTPVHLAAVATAVPPYKADQETADIFFKQHFADRLTTRSMSVLRKVLAHPSIQRRYFAFEDPECLVNESPDERVERFTKWGIELSCASAHMALKRVNLAPADVYALVVNTCTGYICPGLTSYMVERMGFDRSVRTFDLVGSGCGGAIPNLMIGEGQLRAGSGEAVLCVSVEVCSSTFQMGDDIGLLLSNALFGDGAAAAVLWSRPEGLEFIGAASRQLPEEREAIRYVHKNGDLHNQLSTTLPRIISSTIEEVVREVVGQQGLTPSDISHWAMHGGGDSVINEVGQCLGLSEPQLAPTRSILRRFGNMSSPSSLFVLEEVLNNGVKSGEWVLLAAFGAGLTAHACLFRAIENC